MLSDDDAGEMARDRVLSGSRNIAPVAQWIEQRFPKPRVGRSTRPRGTTMG
jgi:hypothetical protein